MSEKSPPPAEIQRLAWEAAQDLGNECRALIAPSDLWRVDSAFRAGPRGQTWFSVCFVFVLHGMIASASRQSKR